MQHYLLAFVTDILEIKRHNTKHPDDKINYVIDAEFRTAPKTYRLVFPSNHLKLQALAIIRRTPPESASTD